MQPKTRRAQGAQDSWARGLSDSRSALRACESNQFRREKAVGSGLQGGKRKESWVYGDVFQRCGALSMAFAAGLEWTHKLSGDGHPIAEVDVLDGVEQLDAFGHGALDGLAS